MPLNCLEVPQLLVTVLSPSSGPSPAHGQPGAAGHCRFLLQPNAPNNCSPSAQHLGGIREALSSSRLSIWVHRDVIPLCLMHKEHFSALHISLNPNSQQRNLGFSTQVKPRAGVQHQPELLTPSQDLELVAGSGLKLWNYLGKLHFGSSVTSRLYFYLTLTKSVACPQLLLHVRILSSINIYFLNPILGQGTSPES